MDQAQQKVIVVDENDNQVEILVRDQAENDQSKIIRMVYVLLYDNEGQVLLQRRNPNLERFPNYWEVSASGSVLENEAYPDVAARKLKDELGLSLPLFHEHKSVIAVSGKANRMTAIFVGKIKELNDIKPNTEKVEEVRWVSPKDASQGYLLTPSCEQVLNWWMEHSEDLIKNIEQEQHA